MTEETKREIAALYADKNTRVVDIAATYKISNGRCKQIALEMGCKPRQKTHVFKDTKIKKCPKCKRAIEISGARFCPFCATDIRSEREILSERVTWLWQIVGVIGANDRDKARNIINDVISFLKKEG